ncbi:MAG: hypothetical protein GW939_02010 [Candidatus Magasanikbacteria bacterium]|nr:hypothetical protein [Candidatus Magasanikbacteria bacterium]NCS72345.1 hypothetical protein [Candidatus Magasanikbacteria bacterium]
MPATSLQKSSFSKKKPTTSKKVKKSSSSVKKGTEKKRVLKKKSSTKKSTSRVKKTTSVIEYPKVLQEEQDDKVISDFSEQPLAQGSLDDGEHHVLAKELLSSTTELLDEDDMLTLGNDDEGFSFVDGDEQEPEQEESEGFHKKRIRKDIDEKLTTIYKNADGSMPDMKHFQKKPRWRFLKAFITFLLTIGFLGAVAYAGFFIFQPQSRFSEADVILSISGDKEVQIGQEVRYRIRYSNAQVIPLTQATLQVRYPEGFVFSESSQLPSNDTNTEWDLGALDKESSGYIDIYGTMFGNLDEERSFRVFLNYTPSNFSSSFQKVANTTVILNDAPVALAVDAPESVVAGAETSFIFDLSLIEDVPLSNVRLMFEPNDRFVISVSEPDSDESSVYAWTFPVLDKDSRVTVKGIFSPVENDDTPVSLTARLVGELNGQDFLYTSQTFDVSVVNADLVASLAINGSLHSFTVQPGEVLNASIHVKNNGSVDLEKMRVRAIFDAPSIEGKSILYWGSLTDELGGAIVGEQLGDDLRRGTITWNQSNLHDLNVLAVGDEFSIDFSLPIKTNEDVPLSTIPSYKAKVLLEVQYESDGESHIFTNAPLELTFNSDVDLDVRDETTDLDGTKTQHDMVWVLTNSFHALTDITLTADIYGDVTVDPVLFVAPAGDVAYDEKEQKVTWHIDTMPTSVDVLALSLPIILNTNNPSQTNLTSQVTLQATDTVTGEQILAVGNGILLPSAEVVQTP